MRLTFIETPLFTAHAMGVITDAELIAVQLALLRDPYAGDLVARTGGVRKIRAAARGSGKRGGARVIYHYSQRTATVFLLLAYAKNESGDLTPAGRKYLKKVVEILDRET